MERKSKRDEVIEVINKLFIYTDNRDWRKLLSEIFTETVNFDTVSSGGQVQKRKASQICDAWEKDFAGIDVLHHQAANFLVKFDSDEIEADVFCYAIALHCKKDATQGKTREYVGTYDLHLALTDEGWRLNGFKYSLKFVNGNSTLA